MFLSFIGAIIGLWFGGFSGLVVGAAVGYVLGRLAQSMVRQRLLQVQVQFVDTTFAVMGALCKADGVVTRDEIHVTEEIFARLHLSPEQQQAAKAAFTRGKASDFDLDAAVDQFAQQARGTGVFLQLFLHLQLLSVSADGRVHPAEHAMLVRIARKLGLSEIDVVRLEALLRAATAGVAGDGAPPQQRLDDAYAALGVSPETSDDELKRAYRKLMLENHPDKVAQRRLPAGMREIAEERAREINVAYDLIKKVRGMA